MDISHALEAKSDQLNAVDIMGFEPVIRVRDVKVTQSDQPVSVFFDGDNGRPWKPSKGMLRILAAGWGKDAKAWTGKHVKIYFESKVRYAGKEVGGIRIRSMTDIPSQGLALVLTINRQNREQYVVPLLKIEVNEYPAERFESGFAAMVGKMQDGSMSLQQVIAHCQKTGKLSADQIERLEKAAPIEVIDEEIEQ